MGPHKKEYTIYSSFIVRQSEELNLIVRGGFEDCAERCAVWDEVDGELLSDSVKFAYTGNYEEGAQKRMMGDFAPIPRLLEGSKGDTFVLPARRNNWKFPAPEPSFAIGKKVDSGKNLAVSTQSPHAA